MRTLTHGAGLVVLVLVAAVCVAVQPASANGSSGAGAVQSDPGFQGETSRIKDLDARPGKKAPTTRQAEAAQRKGVVAQWNKLGTPGSLSRPGGYLQAGLPTDSVTAARRWIADNSDVLGLSADAANALAVVATNPIGDGAAVLLQQQFGGLAAGLDGQISVGVVGGKVAYVSSTLSPASTLSATATLSSEDALRAAAADVGVDVGEVRVTGDQGEWTLLSASTQHQVQKAKLVAVPTPQNGVRPAWEVLVADDTGDVSVQSFIDAADGSLLDRTNLIDYGSDDPTWKAFRAYPNLDYSSTDMRQTWCWTPTAGCDLALQNPLEWSGSKLRIVPQI